MTKRAKNILGTDLASCCTDPMTGFYRNGFCETGEQDKGLHIVCVRVHQEFLDFSMTVGNDLSTARPQYDFPGLKPGDKWCLCALRWKQAYEAGCAPKVCMEGTHIMVLEYLEREWLEEHRLPSDSDN